MAGRKSNTKQTEQPKSRRSSRSRRQTNNMRHEEAKTEIGIEQRRKLVAANLLAGLTYREIAQALGVSAATISNDVKEIRKEWQDRYAEDINHHIATQLRRYDVLLNAVWNDAKSGLNYQAIDRALTVLDKMNQLTGIIARTKLVDDFDEMAIADIRAGRVSFEALADGFDEQYATRLFRAAGTPIPLRKTEGGTGEQ